MTTDTTDTDWTLPDAEGYQRCPVHADAGRFRGLDGCAGCTSDPAPFLAAPTELEIAAERVVGQCAVVEADERGLADMVALELRSERACRDARREAAVCRRIAVEHETRARSILSGAIASTEPERDAQRWFAEAVKVRALVAKHIDVQSKLIKLNLPAAIERWQSKRLLERARLVGMRSGH